MANNQRAAYTAHLPPARHRRAARGKLSLRSLETGQQSSTKGWDTMGSGNSRGLGAGKDHALMMMMVVMMMMIMIMIMIMVMLMLMLMLVVMLVVVVMKDER